MSDPIAMLHKLLCEKTVIHIDTVSPVDSSGDLKGVIGVMPLIMYL